MSNSTYNTFGVWIFVVGISLLTSCEEHIDWELETNQMNTVVVDAVISNEYKYQRVFLSEPYENQNEIPVGLSGAKVKIGINNTFMEFIESPDHAGIYVSPQPISASVNVNYQLLIEVNGKEYQAQTYMIPVLPSQEPQWIYDSEKDLYSIQWPGDLYNPNQQAMYEAIISWSHLVDPSITDTLTYAKLMFYTFSTIDVNYNIFPQDKEQVYFPENSIAIVRKYSLTDEYAAYLRALLAETEWQGSLFEDARGNLPSNLSNGGLGYFSACSVISDTLIVN